MRGVLPPSWFPSHPPCEPRLQGWAGPLITRHAGFYGFTCTFLGGEFFKTLKSTSIQYHTLEEIFLSNLLHLRVVWRTYGPIIFVWRSFKFHLTRGENLQHKNSFQAIKPGTIKAGTMKSLSCWGTLTISDYFRVTAKSSSLLDS